MSNVINLATKLKTVDEPTNDLRWIIRHTEKVLQQYWKVTKMNRVTFEWRDVPIEMEK